MGSGKEVKLKKKKKKVAPNDQKPVKTPEQLAAMRKLREAAKKQAGIDAHTAAKKYVNKLKDRLLQPSRKHYGGLGYAKESVFVELSDPQYAEKFQTIWDEHIPGFSGKSFKKRKSESDDGMIWRKRLEEKAAGSQGLGIDAYISTITSNTSRKRQRLNKAASNEQTASATVLKGASAAAAVRSHASAKQTAGTKPQRSRRRTQNEVVGDAAALQAQAIAAYRKLKSTRK